MWMLQMQLLICAESGKNREPKEERDFAYIYSKRYDNRKTSGIDTGIYFSCLFKQMADALLVPALLLILKKWPKEDEK